MSAPGIPDSPYRPQPIAFITDMRVEPAGDGSRRRAVVIEWSNQQAVRLIMTRPEMDQLRELLRR